MRVLESPGASPGLSSFYDFRRESGSGTLPIVNAPQTWPSAVVDCVIVAAVVGLSLAPNVSPLAWSVLGQIAIVRFGVAITKQAFNGNGNGNGDGSSSSIPRGRRSDAGKGSDDARRVALRPVLVSALVFAASIAAACR